MATRVIFVRHGATDLNAQGVIQGTAPAPLNELGRRQAEAAGRALKVYAPAALYSSPHVRALETAEIMGGILKLPVRQSTRLREQGLGEWEGREWSEIKQHDPLIAQRRDQEGWWFCPPGGEPRLRVRHRMLAFIQEMQQNHPECTVVAVTHAGALYFLVHALIDKTPAGRTHIRTHNGGFSVVQADGERVDLLSLNEGAHLQGLSME